jgi:hypothetical protein
MQRLAPFKRIMQHAMRPRVQRFVLPTIRSFSHILSRDFDNLVSSVQLNYVLQILVLNMIVVDLYAKAIL